MQFLCRAMISLTMKNTGIVALWIALITKTSGDSVDSETKVPLGIPKSSTTRVT